VNGYEQREKIDFIMRMDSQQLGLPPVGERGRQERSQRIAEGRKRRVEKLLNVLTPAQKAKWDHLLGEPFKFAQRNSGGEK
jgi:hypothetical protein